MSSKDRKPAKPSSSSRLTIRTLADLSRPSFPSDDSDSDGPRSTIWAEKKVECLFKILLKEIMMWMQF
ncbi:putative Plant UBX domain-containing protein 3 [Cocos nucifera]|uniref:Putative Plant UBX domain-containing protein 3 n=1 Tax=Cocos nucifera TaxID=13894 RepID=A0A8K0N9N6_COCNU|nr:putative Plant UBX domain-containing protein 3 [Cocos nucifera]